MDAKTATRGTRGEGEASPVGRVLKRWRSHRRMSQMDLALRAGISARHLSFVETGRSRPSREVVLRLAEALAMPFRDRNTLLVAAGYAPRYRETSLSDEELAPVQRALDFMLAQQEPYGAVVIDRAWNVLRANRPHRALLEAFLDPDTVPRRAQENLLHLVFDPAALRPFLANWEVVARALVNRLHREIEATADERLRTLLEEALAYPDVPERWRRPEVGSSPPLLLPIHLRRRELEIRLFNTIATIGTPRDVTLQEIRVEAFFPADEETDRAIRAIVEAGTSGTESPAAAGSGVTETDRDTLAR